MLPVTAERPPPITPASAVSMTRVAMNTALPATLRMCETGFDSSELT